MKAAVSSKPPIGGLSHSPSCGPNASPQCMSEGLPLTNSIREEARKGTTHATNARRTIQESISTVHRLALRPDLVSLADFLHRSTHLLPHGCALSPRESRLAHQSLEGLAEPPRTKISDPADQDRFACENPALR